MPVLRNQKHEAFCIAFASKGMKHAAAYRKAGYRCSTELSAETSGHRLARRADIKERIEELSGKNNIRIAGEQIALAAKMGRPTLYRPEMADMARKLVLLYGHHEYEIAQALGVDERTFAAWKVEHREFSQALTRGGAQADANVAESLYRRSLGYEHLATKIFMPAGAQEPVYAPYVEHYPPDTNAALGWLSRRQPERWKERQQVDISGTLEHRLNQMTPEERAADAVELMERVKRRLAEYRATIEHEAQPETPDQDEQDNPVE